MRTIELIDRERELDLLNQQLNGSSSRRKSAFIMMYGRRRVGKSTLLKAWAQRSGRPFTYWAAGKALAEVQMRKLFAAHTQNRTAGNAIHFETWDAVFEQIAALIGDKPHVLILDEITYAANSDPDFLTALQHAWDQHFQDSAVTLAICGSHFRMMNDLFREGNPLFGRFTLPLELEPMGYAQIRKFFPRWRAEERVAAYAIVGGVPEYYEWLEPMMSLQDNLRQKILKKPSPFLVEGRFLLHDALEQPASHLSIIEAIGAGNTAFDDIRLASEGAKNKLIVYLERLRELRLVERSISALVRPSQRKASRNSRWMLSDPFLRFYFRFIAPALESDEFDEAALTTQVWTHLRGFVGKTAFEDLCREWVRQAGVKGGVLPMLPVIVGRHWSRTVEADVVAVNWEDKALLIGECKWDDDPVTREQARKLIEHSVPKTLADLERQQGTDSVKGWHVHPAYFARRGFTPEAAKYLKGHAVLMRDLKQIDNEIM
jgi:uncharacterized protein